VETVSVPITVVDYNAGNLASVRTALAHCGADAVVTGEAAAVAGAERIVFPGVGAAGAAMRTLNRGGLADAMRDAAGRGVPILGICLGTQVVLDRSEEDGGTACLGLLPGEVHRFRRDRRRLKVPHMGWNGVDRVRPHPVLAGVPAAAEFYFVHSYYPVAGEEKYVIGTTEYGIRFASIVGRANIIAMQFHPEKSGRYGLRILENFLGWTP
jgi:glutamine amidotransferase